MACVGESDSVCECDGGGDRAEAYIYANSEGESEAGWR